MIRNTTMTILLAATVTAAALTQATYVLAATKFDGSWSVVINTARGDCGSGLRYGVRIVGGRVVSENGGYSVAGAVAPNGAIRVMVAEGGRSASGTGRLAGNSGGGVWRTTSGECSGNWAAARHAGW